MFIALSIWKFFYAGFVASHRLQIGFGANDVTTLGYPSPVLVQRLSKGLVQFALPWSVFSPAAVPLPKARPRRTHRPVPAALRLTLHGRRPARSFQFTRCVIRFRSSCFSKGDVPFHGQYIGVETSVFLNRCLFTGSSHTEVCMGPSALSRRMFKASCNRTCRPLFITEKTPAGNEILNGWKLRNAECFLRSHKRADSLFKTSSI